MSSLDADVNIRLNAEDNASQPIDNSVKSIDRSFVQMRNSLRANERSFYLQHQSVYQLTRAMGVLRSVTGVGVSVMNNLLLTQIRNATEAKNLRDAIRDENDAIIEFGYGSRQANDAHERTTEIMKQQHDQLIQNILQWVTLGTYLASTIVPNLTKIKGLIGGGSISKVGGVPSGSSSPVGNIQGPNLPKNGIGSGPPGGAGGIGLIGGVGFGINVAQTVLHQMGIDPSGNIPRTSFSTLDQMASQKPTINVIINGKSVATDAYE